MNICVDRHHAALSHSLHLLFEKRLNHSLYFPIGLEWAKDWWRIHAPYNFNQDTAKQYLQIKPEHIPMDGTAPLNHAIKEFPTHYEVEDVAFGYTQKCITFEQFRQMDIDIIIATYQPHYELYTKLRDAYHPKAKVICQAGNAWDIDFSVVKNLMSSTLPFEVPNIRNAVFYHQEYSLETYRYRPPQEMFLGKGNIIASFVNTLGCQALFVNDWEDFKALEKALGYGWMLGAFGAGCRNGVINEQEKIAQKMSGCSFVFHLKTGGDGYGHTMHQIFASGRPVIYRGSQYQGKLGGLLLKDMETGIDLDKHSIQETADMIQQMSDAEHKTMCDAAYRTFKQQVDFDKEQKDIERFLERLQ